MSKRRIEIKSGSLAIIIMGLILFAHCGRAADSDIEDSSSQANLLFKSGFEGRVNIVSVGKRHKISGADESYVWPNDLPGAGNRNFFNYIVSGKKDYNQFINTDIVTVTGRYGQPTRALYQAILKNDKDTRALTRNQYNMYPSLTADTFKQMYVKYWLKFQPDLDEIMPKNSWRMMMEWFESGDDYRFNLQVIRTHQGGGLKWKLLGQILKPKREYDWLEINDQIQVPVGEWFLLEVFWKHSSEPDGQILVKINGKDLFNHIGRNKLNSRLSVLMPFKCYGRTDYSQWIDDFEIWDSIPQVSSR